MCGVCGRRSLLQWCRGRPDGVRVGRLHRRQDPGTDEPPAAPTTSATTAGAPRRPRHAAAARPVRGQPGGARRSPRAISELPRDPRSQQAWNTEPIAGNYNECAQLSAVIVKANTNAANPNTRAVLFHQGKYIPTGVPDTFGFNGIDTSQSTGDTVALKYTGGIGPGQRGEVPLERQRGGADRQHARRLSDVPRPGAERPEPSAAGPCVRARLTPTGRISRVEAPRCRWPDLQWLLCS